MIPTRTVLMIAAIVAGDALVMFASAPANAERIDPRQTSTWCNDCDSCANGACSGGKCELGKRQRKPIDVDVSPINVTCDVVIPPTVDTQAAAREQTAQKAAAEKAAQEKAAAEKAAQEKAEQEKAYHGVLALVIGVCVVLALGIGFAGQVNAAKV